MIKGGGACLLWERIVADAADYYVVVADTSKLKDRLGAFPLPIEVVPHGWESTTRSIGRLLAAARLPGRRAAGAARRRRRRARGHRQRQLPRRRPPRLDRRPARDRPRAELDPRRGRERPLHRPRRRGALRRPARARSPSCAAGPRRPAGRPPRRAGAAPESTIREDGARPEDVPSASDDDRDRSEDVDAGNGSRPYGRRGWSRRTRAGRATSRRCAASTSASSAGEVFGFLGPNGAGKCTTVKMLTTLLTITAGPAPGRRHRRRREPGRGPRAIGVALQEAGLDPRQTGRELLDAAGPPVRDGHAGGHGARRGAARAGRARGRGRPPHQGLLGRHEAAARPGLGAGARAGRAVPRRADDRARPGEPADDLGRGPADQRARDDGLPHHAVPRGGRPALRPAGDHRRRDDRARGHAGAAQGRPARAPRARRRPDARRRVPRRHRPHARPRRAGDVQEVRA